jgi:FkbM family methyltransferase
MAFSHPPEREPALLAAALSEDESAFMVDVGANEPFAYSVSAPFEARGWHGVLIEPLPNLAARLRRERNWPVFEVACTDPAHAGGTAELIVAGQLSGLAAGRVHGPSESGPKIQVTCRTLDSVLDEVAAPRPIDLISIDVEGHQLQVLRGLNLERWAPRLLLIEDHLVSTGTDRYLRRRGYTAVRRTGLNTWYVPRSQARHWQFGPIDRLARLRKLYLGTPIRRLRYAQAARRRAKRQAGTA